MNILFYIIACLCLVALCYLLVKRRHGKQTEQKIELSIEQKDVRNDELKDGRNNELKDGQKEELKDEQTDDDDEKSVTQNRQLIDHLHKVLEEDMVFLQPDIRIDDVAKIICSNRTYVTRLMRQEYGLTFNEYVNVARIQYSQKLLYTSPDKTLDEIAEMSGFQSTSNYCRAFKRYIGTSPIAWLESVK
ncbi:MAG: helix-turn-helix transcriptional regulator [Bacteroidales bacterium]|nr:helix-turn-helix transcriptional regulator [Candidatus Liminaster caballi]